MLIKSNKKSLNVVLGLSLLCSAAGVFAEVSLTDWSTKSDEQKLGLAKMVYAELKAKADVTNPHAKKGALEELASIITEIDTSFTTQITYRPGLEKVSGGLWSTWNKVCDNSWLATGIFCLGTGALFTGSGGHGLVTSIAYIGGALSLYQSGKQNAEAKKLTFADGQEENFLKDAVNSARTAGNWTTIS